jgi:hypothetical protein
LFLHPAEPHKSRVPSLLRDWSGDLSVHAHQSAMNLQNTASRFSGTNHEAINV